MTAVDAPPTHIEVPVPEALCATEHLSVALAAEMARDGRRTDATELLLSLPGESSPERSDLLARIYAQTGDLDAAEREWGKVPDDHSLAREARAGLRRVEILRRRPRWLRFNLGFVGLVVVLCFAVAAGAVGGVVALSSSSPGSAASSADQSGAADEPSVARATPLVDATPIHSAIPTSAAAAPSIPLDSPGTTVAQRGATLVVTFDRGLFRSGGATLNHSSEALLTSVAERLKGSGEPVALRVIGHTDSVPPSGGPGSLSNAALGFARAAAAAAFLQRAAGIPLSSVSVASAGSSEPVADNSTPGGRRRNRTVVLEVRSP